MSRKCSYCNDWIVRGEQYYELTPLIGVFLHIDCITGKLITLDSQKYLQVSVNLLTQN